ncbi:hypothetical protein EJ02DRAFT_478737, partial [Clathrospora elynae]
HLHVDITLSLPVPFPFTTSASLLSAHFVSTRPSDASTPILRTLGFTTAPTSSSPPCSSLRTCLTPSATSSSTHSRYTNPFSNLTPSFSHGNSSLSSPSSSLVPSPISSSNLNRPLPLRFTTFCVLFSRPMFQPSTPVATTCQVVPSAPLPFSVHSIYFLLACVAARSLLSASPILTADMRVWSVLCGVCCVECAVWRCRKRFRLVAWTGLLRNYACVPGLRGGGRRRGRRADRGEYVEEFGELG